MGAGVPVPFRPAVYAVAGTGRQRRPGGAPHPRQPGGGRRSPRGRRRAGAPRLRLRPHGSQVGSWTPRRWTPANAWAWLPCAPPPPARIRRTWSRCVASLRSVWRTAFQLTCAPNVRASSPRVRAVSTAGSTSANPTAASPAEVPRSRSSPSTHPALPALRTALLRTHPPAAPVDAAPADAAPTNTICSSGSPQHPLTGVCGRVGAHVPTGYPQNLDEHTASQTHSV